MPEESSHLYPAGPEGNPLFVISRLAVHRTNVLADQRASLLVAEAVDAGIDPLARSRVTLPGDVAPVPSAEQEAAVEAVASRVPGVAGYVSLHHVDRFGCAYTARLDDGVAIVRLAFSTPATGLDDVRRRMVDLVREARKR